MSSENTNQDTAESQAPPGEEKPRAGGLLARYGPEAAIFLFFLAVTLFLTWPLIIRINTSTYGYASDNQGTIWLMWWLRNAGQFGAKSSFCPIIGYPFGAPITVFLFEPLAELAERFMLLFANEVFVYNTELLSSFFLSGVTMYFLVRHLTRDRRAALFGGFAYMACVFHSYNSMVFIRLALMQWMPLYILALLWFIEKPSFKRAAWLAVAGLLVGGTSIHYAFFMWIFTATFLIGRYAYIRYGEHRLSRADPARPRSRHRFNRRTALLGVGAALVVILLTMPFYLLVLSNLEETGEWNTRSTPGAVRSMETSTAGSAKAYDYILPNKENFLLGGITTRLMGDRVNAFENSLYLGWVVILLSVYALVVMIAQGRREAADAGASSRLPSPPVDRDADLDPDRDLEYAGAGLAPARGLAQATGRTGGRVDAAFGSQNSRAIGWGLLLSAAVAFILSLPPYLRLGGHKIPMPSMIFRYVAPWLRWYLRFGVVVLLCLVVLGSMGLASLMGRLKRFPWEIALVGLLAFSFMETTLVPPFRNFDFSVTPEAFQKIGQFDDDFGTVIYPAFEPGFFASARYLLYQRDYRKPILNGGPDNTDGEALRRTVYNPFNPAVPGILKRFDITHVVYLGQMFRKYEGTEPTSEEEVAHLPPGLRLTDRITSSDDYSDAYIYEVTADPADFVPIYLGDITVPHIDKGRITVRLMESKGVIKILNFTGADARVRLTLPITNISYPHEVGIKCEGKTVWKTDLDDAESTVAVVDDIIVPAEGVDLEVLVNGPLSVLDAAEGFVFGTNTVAVKLGDLTIDPAGR